MDLAKKLWLTVGFLPCLCVAASTEPGGDGWPMFRGNPALTGVTSDTLPPKLNLLWNFKTGGPVKSSPAIINGKVLVGSDDGYLYCLNLKDGSKEWSFKAGAEVESSPLIQGDKVFVGSNDGFLYAL